MSEGTETETETGANGGESQTEQETQGGSKGEPIRLPDDHPLVRAFQAQKDRNAELSGKVKEYEDADKSEADKLRDKVREGETASLAAIRFEVALDKGLTKAQAKRLVGSTREEIEADADELVADLGIASKDDDKAPPAGGSGRPKEKLRPGASNEGEPEPDYDKLAESIRGNGL